MRLGLERGGGGGRVWDGVGRAKCWGDVGLVLGWWVGGWMGGGGERGRKICISSKNSSIIYI